MDPGPPSLGVVGMSTLRPRPWAALLLGETFVGVVGMAGGATAPAPASSAGRASGGAAATASGTLAVNDGTAAALVVEAGPW